MTDEQLIEHYTETINLEGHYMLDNPLDGSDLQIERIVSKMQKDGRFMLDISPLNKKWIIKHNPNYKKPSYVDKHPYWHALWIALIGTAISQLITLGVQIPKDQEQHLKNIRQDSLQKNLYDSLTSVRKQIEDYENRLKKDKGENK